MKVVPVFSSVLLCVSTFHFTVGTPAPMISMAVDAGHSAAEAAEVGLDASKTRNVLDSGNLGRSVSETGKSKVEVETRKGSLDDFVKTSREDPSPTSDVGSFSPGSRQPSSQKPKSLEPSDDHPSSYNGDSQAAGTKKDMGTATRGNRGQRRPYKKPAPGQKEPFPHKIDRVIQHVSNKILDFFLNIPLYIYKKAQAHSRFFGQVKNKESTLKNARVVAS